MGAKKLCINGYVLTNSFFEKYLHIPLPIYEFILERIKSKIEKKDTHFRVPIAAGARLEATLLFLVTGRSYSRLQYLNRIEKKHAREAAEEPSLFHHLSVDAANQASLMYDAWKRNKVNLTPRLAHSDPLSIEARISIK